MPDQQTHAPPAAVPPALTPAAPRGFTLARPVRMPTLMLVEDSRFACEVMRLYARALGLRLRRAEDLDTAQTHLRLYRPDIALIDLGLPDGRGEGLIADLAASQPRPPLIIATSGQTELRSAALAAGADLFLDKPLPDIATFRALLVEHFPSPLPLLLLPGHPPRPRPDRLALQDDLNMAAHALAGAGGLGDQPLTAARTRYVAGLVDGIAASLGDDDLQQAARRQLAHNATAQGVAGDMAVDMDAAGQQSFRQLRDLVNERLRDVMAQKGF